MGMLADDKSATMRSKTWTRLQFDCRHPERQEKQDILKRYPLLKIIAHDNVFNPFARDADMLFVSRKP